MADGKTIVVTGASAGVGRAAVRALAERGWRIGLIARGREGLEATCAEVERRGGEALVLPADVADAAAVEAAADEAAGRWGGIDAWMNAAMATVFAPFEEMSAEEFRRVTEVTYLGQVHGVRAALRHMRPRNSGRIICIGSALAYRGIPLQSAYCGAKFAVRGFLDSLRAELEHEGSRVRITMVQLPAVNTPQFDWARNKMPMRPRPVPPVYAPEAAAGAIMRAIAESPRELWVGTSTLKVIAGETAAPELLDRMLARKAWSGQQTREPAQEGRPDNLFEPVEGDFGAEGRFGDSAQRHVLTMDPARLRAGAAFATLAGTAAGIACALALGAHGRPRVPLVPRAFRRRRR